MSSTKAPTLNLLVCLTLLLQLQEDLERGGRRRAREKLTDKGGRERKGWRRRKKENEGRERR